jgi:hypothetical protein
MPRIHERRGRSAIGMEGGDGGMTVGRPAAGGNETMRHSQPRFGEFVTPENGAVMEVVAVDYSVVSQGEHEFVKQPVLVPFIYLEAVEDEHMSAVHRGRVGWFNVLSR